MARMSLPPGFRFHPTNEELVKYYLKRKLLGKKFKFEAISELDIYKYSPWDLRDKSCLRSKDLEWYFFCPIEKKYGSGARMNRATESGFWKSTGKDRIVLYKLQTVGMVKTLVFHKGHAPKGERTDWVMYEYRMQDNELADAGVVQDAYVLCKIFQKNGPGPQNGAQYGAPFNEEDYDDDGEFCAESLPSVAHSLPALPPNNFVFVPGSTSSGPLSDPGPSKAFNSADEVPPPPPDNIDNGEICAESLPSVAQPLPALPSNNSVFVPGSTSSGPLSDPGPSKAIPSVDEVPLAARDNIDDIVSMLDIFIEDSVLLPCENGNNMVESVHANPNGGLACLDATGIYNGLGDLDNNWAGPSGDGFNFSSHLTMEHGLNPMVAGNGTAFLELNDLNNPIRFAAEDMGSEHFLAENLWATPYYDYNNWLPQNCFPTDSVGSAQLDSALNQSSLLPEGSNGLWDHLDASQMGNCNWGGADLGFASTSCHVEAAPCELLEGGTRQLVQGQNSGGSPDLGRIGNNSNDWNHRLHSTSNSNITRL